MKYKTVLVTGGCGFIGSHLVDALVDISERVVVIDKNEPRPDRKNAAVKYYESSVQDPKIEEIFKKEMPERLFHLGAHIQDRESVEQPIMNVEHNIIGSVNVFEAFKKHCKGKILFASSAAVYGVQDRIPITEQFTLHPGTPYGISKLAGERYLFFYHHVHNIPFTALRMANVYGPRQNPGAERS
ncbi:NAD-dependent epimerase/dehydratase family protein, partial [Patescibacteria group bacterium]|nr:NAD-dependent epimerase/dehydratase family protein [Patescibacteria group bacterium]